MENKRKLRVAVVGLTIGKFHLEDYLKSPSVEDVIVCDTSKERLHSIADAYGIQKRYTDFSKMLAEEKPDAVSLAVPNFLHCSMAIQAMESGCHVLCEKPLARNAKEAQLMYDTMQRTGKKLMVNFNQRFNPECRALKGMIEEGKLGEIYFIRTMWKRQRGVPWWYPLANGVETCGGGPVIDLGVHVLDRALWMCDYPEVKSILANTFHPIAPREGKERGIHFPLEDMGVAMIRLENGCMIELEASWATNSSEEEVIMTQIYGSRGGALLSYTQGNFVYLEKSPSTVETLPLDDSTFRDGYTIRQAFLNAILEDKEVPCSAANGLKMNQILDGIYESAKKGCAIEF